MSAAQDLLLARAIAARFYGSEPEIEPITRLNHLVFRLRFADSCKILKLAKGTYGASLRKEVRLIQLLARHGIPVPFIEHHDGESPTAGRPFLIMDSAGEETVADWIGRSGGAARRLFAEMGAVLARIHTLTFPTSADSQPYGLAPRNAATELPRLCRLSEWAAEEGLLERREISLFASLPLPSAAGVELCHGDFHAVQCIVREGRIAAVVDWESAWTGNATIDFAVAHTYLDYYCPAELRRCFLQGYAGVRALPDDYESAYLPVRMAQALGLLRVWHARGRRPGARRAIDLFRAYARQCDA